jgi:hypothetical protein
LIRRFTPETNRLVGRAGSEGWENMATEIGTGVVEEIVPGGGPLGWRVAESGMGGA